MMIKEIISIIESILAGILIVEAFIPFFIDLSKNIGGWAYYGLFCFIVLVVILEYRSYKENNITWIASKILGVFEN